MKKLIKSYRFWTALAGAFGLFVVSIAKLFGHTMNSVVVEELVMAVCGVLIVFGIVKKPETEESTTKQTKETKKVNQHSTKKQSKKVKNQTQNKTDKNQTQNEILNDQSSKEENQITEE